MTGRNPPDRGVAASPANGGAGRGDRFDALTGLPGRAEWLSSLTKLLQLLRHDDVVAVALVDVDRFAEVNESFGFSAGDAILQAVGELLSMVPGPQGLTAHLGGDRFALVAPARGWPAAMSLAHRVKNILSGPFVSAQEPLYLTVSIAVAAVDAPIAAESIMAAVERALRRAKRRGGASIEVATDVTARAAADRLLLLTRLHQAVANQEFILHYQPVVDLRARRIVAAEALLRWPTSEGIILGPDEFLDLAEASTLIVPLGEWALAEACRQAAKWRRLSGRPIRVAVNLSGRQLHDPDVVAQVAAGLSASDLDPQDLCLEITETVLMDEFVDEAHTLPALRDLGVRLSIDDFGTGHSSLARLRSLPVDELKIDRSFVAGLGRDATDDAVVAAILRMADTLNIDAVAEGAERPEQVRALDGLGCSLVQGFLYSPPVDAGAFTSLLSDERAVVSPAGTRPGSASPPPVTGDVGVSNAIVDVVDDLIAYLLHELHTPLMLQRWLSAELLEHLHASDLTGARDRLGDLVRQVDTVDHLVATLDDLRRLHTGGRPIERAPMDLAVLVRLCVADCARLHPDRRIALDAPTALPLHADAPRLEQLVTSLLSNAIKYSPMGTPVHVTLDTGSSDEARLSVVDQGPPLSGNLRDLALEELGRPGRHRPGMAASLHLARGVAHAHGGDLTYRRADAGGALVELTLPAG